MSRTGMNLVCIAASTLLAACLDAGPVSPGAEVELIEVMPYELTLTAIGEQAQLYAVARDANGGALSDVLFDWYSSDHTVVQVSDTGLVWSTGYGAATVGARVSDDSPVGQGSNVEGFAYVTVQSHPTGLQIDVPEADLFEGQAMRLTAWVVDAYGHRIGQTPVDNGVLQWAVSDTSVAVVDAGGLLTGVAMGPVTVRVSRQPQHLSAGNSAIALANTDTAAVNVRVRFSALELGAYHSCGLTEAERIYCWGSNGEGRLGSRSAVDSMQRDRHYPVRGLRKYQLVSAGDSHTCAIDIHGDTYCWGNNTEGQLGDGTSNWDQNIDPTPVSGSLAFAALGLGWRSTCGITVSGELYCWGFGTSGRLGNGDTTAVLTPTSALSSLTFVELAVGEHHGCGISDQGLMYCWGDNSGGQLGTVSGETCTDIFRNVTDCATVPTLVTDTLEFESVTASRAHTCGIGVDGRGYCWGEGVSGRLGTGDSLPRAQPALVVGGLTFKSISAGIEHTCGVATDGFAYCWGANGVGQLGDGTRIDRSTPVRTLLDAPVKQVSCGASHTCGLTAGDVAYCWGHAFQGQLGDGQTISSAVPVRVLGQKVN